MRLPRRVDHGEFVVLDEGKRLPEWTHTESSPRSRQTLVLVAASLQSPVARLRSPVVSSHSSPPSLHMPHRDMTIRKSVSLCGLCDDCVNCLIRLDTILTYECFCFLTVFVFLQLMKEAEVASQGRRNVTKS